jgi:uncharacterized paraquat-inducible protein A
MNLNISSKQLVTKNNRIQQNKWATPVTVVMIVIPTNIMNIAYICINAQVSYLHQNF